MCTYIWRMKRICENAVSPYKFTHGNTLTNSIADEVSLELLCSLVRGGAGFSLMPGTWVLSAVMRFCISDTSVLVDI